jgi:glutamate dehydrogenase/leucine dehydrogenase
MNFSNTSSVPLQEQIFEWKDEESDALGWVFIDSVVNGCSFGVLVMNETCSRETVLAQAKQASLAASVCVPQTGGAAAGIRLASPTEVEDRKPILTRFMRAQEALLSNALVLTGETDAEMLAIDDAAHSIGLSGAVHALAKLFSDETGQANFGDTFVHKLRLLSSRVNFCELAQAFGIGQVINCLEEITPLAYKPRVVIDGFGSLGSSLAYFIENLGIGSVVAIRDGLEHISRNDGLPVAEILRSRVEKRRTMQKKKLKNSNLLRYLDEVQLHRFHASADSVLCVEADLIVLCTSERKLSTLEDLDQLLATLSGSGAHFLFPALPLSRSQDLLLDSEEGKKVLDNQDQQVTYYKDNL